MTRWIGKSKDTWTEGRSKHKKKRAGKHLDNDCNSDT